MTKEERKIQENLIEVIEKEEDDEKLQKECLQLLRMGKKKKSDRAIGCAYYYLAANDMMKGRFRSSIENVENAITYLKKAKEFLLYTKAFNVQGIAYSELGNDTVATECYLNGLESARENHIPDLQVWFYNNIGSRFQEGKEDETALIYLEKARKYLDSGKRKERFPYVIPLVLYMNIGNSYIHIGEYEKGEAALMDAIHLAEENKDDTYGFALLCLRSFLYWKTDRKEFVYEHLDEMMDMVIDGTYINDYTQNITEFAGLLTDMEEYGKLDKILTLYEKYAEGQASRYLKMVSLELRLDYYKKLGDEEQYREYAVRYTQISLERKKKSMEERTNSLQLRIELREKEIQRKQAQKREEKLKQKSEKDALTGIGNRYSMDRYGRTLIARAIKENQNIGIGVMDIDSFKQYNDTYGHLKGDKCLALAASVIQEKVGERGGCFRYGGDEFVVLLENTTKEELEQVGEKIKTGLELLKIPHINSDIKKIVTMSQGYVCLLPEKGQRLNELLKGADAALYEVKKHGKNDFLVIKEGKCQ